MSNLKLKEYLQSEYLRKNEEIINNFKNTKWKLSKIYIELLWYFTTFLYKHRDWVYIEK